MSGADKIHNAAQDAAGKGKEAVGKVTDDDELEAEARLIRRKPMSSRPLKRSKTPSSTNAHWEACIVVVWASSLPRTRYVARLSKEASQLSLTTWSADLSGRHPRQEG